MYHTLSDRGCTIRARADDLGSALDGMDTLTALALVYADAVAASGLLIKIAKSALVLLRRITPQRLRSSGTGCGAVCPRGLSYNSRRRRPSTSAPFWVPGLEVAPRRARHCQDRTPPLPPRRPPSACATRTRFPPYPTWPSCNPSVFHSELGWSGYLQSFALLAQRLLRRRRLCLGVTGLCRQRGRPPPRVQPHYSAVSSGMNANRDLWLLPSRRHATQIRPLSSRLSGCWRHS